MALVLLASSALLRRSVLLLVLSGRWHCVCASSMALVLLASSALLRRSSLVAFAARRWHCVWRPRWPLSSWHHQLFCRRSACCFCCPAMALRLASSMALVLLASSALCRRSVCFCCPAMALRLASSMALVLLASSALCRRSVCFCCSAMALRLASSMALVLLASSALCRRSVCFCCSAMALRLASSMGLVLLGLLGPLSQECLLLLLGRWHCAWRPRWPLSSWHPRPSVAGVFAFAARRWHCAWRPRWPLSSWHPRPSVAGVFAFAARRWHCAWRPRWPLSSWPPQPSVAGVYAFAARRWHCAWRPRWPLVFLASSALCRRSVCFCCSAVSFSSRDITLCTTFFGLCWPFHRCLSGRLGSHASPLEDREAFPPVLGDPDEVMTRISLYPLNERWQQCDCAT